MKRYLIINADDFGVNYAANEAIEHIFNEGTVSTTTLMTPCPWAEDAVARAKRNPRMRVGLHLTITSEWIPYRWGPVSRTPVPSLLDAGGYFPRSAKEVLSTANAQDVQTEINAQLQFMLSRGLRPTHVDNHMGTLYGRQGPSFMPQVFALCAREKWPFRLPRTFPLDAGASPELLSQLPLLADTADRLGIGTIDHLLAHPFPVKTEDGYQSLKDFYFDLIRGLQPGISEIYAHPAKDTEEQKAICPDWQKRAWEYRLLLDPDLPKLLDEEGIILTNWVDAPFFPRG